MKKKYAKEQLQEAITRVNNIVENSIGSFQKPIIPGDCPTFVMKLRQTMLWKDWDYT